MSAKAQTATERDNAERPSFGKQAGSILTIVTLLTVLLGGVSWLFSVKETAQDAAKTAQQTAVQVQQLSTKVDGKADKAEVQQMRTEIRDDLKEIKRQLFLMNGGRDVTWVKRPPKAMPSSPKVE